MRQYTDTQGQPHPIELNLGIRKRIRDHLGIDLVQLARDPKQLEALLNRVSDIDQLMEFCSFIESVPVEQLECCWNADTAESAGIAVVEAIADFFPASSPLKKPLMNLMDKAKAGQAIAADAIERKLMQAVDEFDLSMVDTKQTTQTNGCGDSERLQAFSPEPMGSID
jgi:microcystin degradation protein MlrC